MSFRVRRVATYSPQIQASDGAWDADSAHTLTSGGAPGLTVRPMTDKLGSGGKAGSAGTPAGHGIH